MPISKTTEVRFRDLRTKDQTALGHVTSIDRKVKWLTVQFDTGLSRRVEVDGADTTLVTRFVPTNGDMVERYAERVEVEVAAALTADEKALASFNETASKNLLYAVTSKTEELVVAGRTTERARQIMHAVENVDHCPTLSHAVALVASGIRRQLVERGPDDTWSGRIKNEIARGRRPRVAPRDELAGRVGRGRRAPQRPAGRRRVRTARRHHLNR